MSIIQYTALDYAMLKVIAAGIHGQSNRLEIQRRMALDHGLVLSRTGDRFIPLQNAETGFVEERMVWLNDNNVWLDCDFKKVDVTGKVLTLDREGTIILRTL